MIGRPDDSLRTGNRHRDSVPHSREGTAVALHRRTPPARPRAGDPVNAIVEDLDVLNAIALSATTPTSPITPLELAASMRRSSLSVAASIARLRADGLVDVDAADPGVTSTWHPTGVTKAGHRALAATHVSRTARLKGLPVAPFAVDVDDVRAAYINERIDQVLLVLVDDLFATIAEAIPSVEVVCDISRGTLAVIALGPDGRCGSTRLYTFDEFKTYGCVDTLIESVRTIVAKTMAAENTRIGARS